MLWVQWGGTQAIQTCMTVTKERTTTCLSQQAKCFKLLCRSINPAFCIQMSLLLVIEDVSAVEVFHEQIDECSQEQKEEKAVMF